MQYRILAKYITSGDFRTSILAASIQVAQYHGASARQLCCYRTHFHAMLHFCITAHISKQHRGPGCWMVAWPLDVTSRKTTSGYDTSVIGMVH